MLYAKNFSWSGQNRIDITEYKSSFIQLTIQKHLKISQTNQQ